MLNRDREKWEAETGKKGSEEKLDGQRDAKKKHIEKDWVGWNDPEEARKVVNEEA